MKIHYSCSPADANTLSTPRLRETFLISDLFRPGEVHAHYTDLDRMIVGGAVPSHEALPLLNDKAIGTNFFLERREIGIINIGGPGTVKVRDDSYRLATHDCLYIGRGEDEVIFTNTGEGQPRYYFVSTPAHAKYPTTLVQRASVTGDILGETNAANLRRLIKYIHPDGVKSCQLVLGFTELEPGSVWNTMPPHLHGRRTEIYLYFDLGEKLVVHLMGEPRATRHLVVRDGEAVLSPAWSVHSGAGTGNYRFVWAMGGDNQSFADMDPVSPGELR